MGSYAFAEAKDPLKDCFRIIKDPFEGDLSESALGFVGGFKKGEGFLRDLLLGSYKFVEAKDPWCLRILGFLVDFFERRIQSPSLPPSTPHIT